MDEKIINIDQEYLNTDVLNPEEDFDKILNRVNRVNTDLTNQTNLPEIPNVPLGKWLFIVIFCNLYMISILLVTFSFKFFFDFSLKCDSSNDWGDIIYDDKRVKCSLKCSEKSGEIEKHVSNSLHYISSALQSMFSGMLILDFRFTKGVFVYTLYVVFIRLVEIFTYDIETPFVSYIKNVVSVIIGPFIIAIFDKKKVKTVVYVTVIYLFITFYRILYEIVFVFLFRKFLNLKFSIILPFATLIFNIFFTQIIKFNTPKNFYPYLKVSISFVYYSYFKALNFGYNIYNLEKNGFNLLLVCDILVNLIIDLLNLYQIPKYSFFFSFNFLFNTNFTIKKRDSFRKILNSFIPFYDIFCFSIYLITYLTNTAFSDYLSKDIVDCYRTFNKNIFIPNLEYIYLLLTMYGLKNILYIFLHKKVFLRMVSQPDFYDFYIPDIKSYKIILGLICVIGHTAISLMLKGYYTGILLKVYS